MLFPRALGAGPRTAVTLADVDDGPARGLVARRDRPRRRRRRLRRGRRRPRHARCSASTRAAGSPGRTCAATASTAGAWTHAGSAPIGLRGRRRPGSSSGPSDEAAGLALVYELEALRRRRPARPGHRHQHRRRASTSSTASRSCCRSPTTTSSCSTSPAATSASAPRSGTPSTDGLWLREGRGGRPGLDAATMVVAGTAGLLHHARRAWSACTSAGAATRCCGSSAPPPHGATIGGGELLLPGEVVLPTGASYASPWVYVAASDDGLDGLAAAWHELPAVARPPTRRTSRWSSTSGRRSSSTTTSTGLRQIADRAAQRGRGAVRARRRLVPRPPRRHRRASATGWSTSRCGPTGWTR